MPTIRLSRVQSRDSVRDSDVAGVAALHNASPFGDYWKIQVSPATRGELFSLEDVEIDLYIAMIREA